MRKTTVSAVLFHIRGCSPPRAKAAPPATKDTSGTIVITFKDGHQQLFPVSSIGRIELKAASGTSTPISIPSIVIPGEAISWQVGSRGRKRRHHLHDARR